METNEKGCRFVKVTIKNNTDNNAIVAMKMIMMMMNMIIVTWIMKSE